MAVMSEATAQVFMRALDELGMARAGFLDMIDQLNEQIKETEALLKPYHAQKRLQRRYALRERAKQVIERALSCPECGARPRKFKPAPGTVSDDAPRRPIQFGCPIEGHPRVSGPSIEQVVGEWDRVTAVDRAQRVLNNLGGDVLGPMPGVESIADAPKAKTGDVNDGIMLCVHDERDRSDYIDETEHF